MIHQPGRVFSRKELLQSFNDVVFDGYERNIDAHIKNLRRKLEPNPSEPIYVQTVYGVGYKFNTPGSSPDLNRT